jgi:hypothetical protein
MGATSSGFGWLVSDITLQCGYATSNIYVLAAFDRGMGMRSTEATLSPEAVKDGERGN